jgi:hypothetical protein
MYRSELSQGSPTLINNSIFIVKESGIDDGVLTVMSSVRIVNWGRKKVKILQIISQERNSHSLPYYRPAAK